MSAEATDAARSLLIGMRTTDKERDYARLESIAWSLLSIAESLDTDRDEREQEGTNRMAQKRKRLDPPKERR